MPGKGKTKRRFNTYFRQTPKAFRAARQTSVFSHINRNIPYRMYQFSKERFLQGAKAISRLTQVKKYKFFKNEPPQKEE